MSEVRLPASVEARHFVDLPEDDAPPGAFTYYVDNSDQVVGMIYVCPCGCGQRGSLRFRPLPSDAQERASWEWDGNKETPTLSPSVHHVGHWHGWLQSGEWRQA